MFSNEQLAHGETAEIGEARAEFSQSILENWHPEFLQLWSFDVMYALSSTGVT